jgi:hypothetical protein
LFNHSLSLERDQLFRGLLYLYHFPLGITEIRWTRSH